MSGENIEKNHNVWQFNMPEVIIVYDNTKLLLGKILKESLHILQTKTPQHIAVLVQNLVKELIVYIS